MELKYILDHDVDECTDALIREVLSTCFSDQPVFNTRRYYYEMPLHRWLLLDSGIIAAHIAMHEKEIDCDGEKIKIGAVAEVCVRPEYRGHGYVKKLLMESHVFLKSIDFPFAMLFANHPNVYSPSGYKLIDNLVRFLEPETGQYKSKVFNDLMVAQLSDRQWPAAAIDLQGPKF